MNSPLDVPGAKIWCVPFNKTACLFFCEGVNSTHDISFDGQMTSNTTMLSFFICILIAYVFMSH